MIVNENFRPPRFGFLIVGQDEELEDGGPTGPGNLLHGGVEGVDAGKYNS